MVLEMFQDFPFSAKVDINRLEHFSDPDKLPLHSYLSTLSRVAMVAIENSTTPSRPDTIKANCTVDLWPTQCDQIWWFIGLWETF